MSEYLENRSIFFCTHCHVVNSLVEVLEYTNPVFFGYYQLLVLFGRPNSLTPKSVRFGKCLMILNDVLYVDWNTVKWNVSKG